MTKAPQRSASASANRWRHGLGIWLGKLFLATAVCGFLYFDLKGFDALPSVKDCSLEEEAHSSSIETMAYSHLSALAHFTPRPTSVQIVTISPESEPLSVMTNTCENRRFLTLLLGALNRFHPQVIGIDQSYSADSCADETINANLRSVARAGSQVVVGQATHDDPELGDQKTCLIETRPFDFNAVAGPRSSKNPQSAERDVESGLVRLNQDTRKIPLQWDVYPDEATAQTKDSARIVYKDGFAFRVAQAMDSSLVQNQAIQNLQQQHRQPYGEYQQQPRALHAMQILCSDPALVNQQKVGSCQGVEAFAGDLTGKAIIVGDRVDSDRQTYWHGPVYGFQLQAMYVDDLLQGHYLRTANYVAELIVVCVALLLSLFVDWQYTVHRKGEDLKALAGQAILLVILILLSFACIQFGYFPPLSIAMSGALLPLLATTLFRTLIMREPNQKRAIH